MIFSPFLRSTPFLTYSRSTLNFGIRRYSNSKIKCHINCFSTGSDGLVDKRCFLRIVNDGSIALKSGLRHQPPHTIRVTQFLAKPRSLSFVNYEYQPIELDFTAKLCFCLYFLCYQSVAHRLLDLLYACTIVSVFSNHYPLTKYPLSPYPKHQSPNLQTPDRYISYHRIL